MARSTLFDEMQNHPFWLFDVFTASSPSLPVFNPLWGFATCTAPEWGADVVSIQEGNRQYPRKVYKSGSLAPITLTRGARFYDNDFYRWLTVAAKGNPSYFSEVNAGLDIGGATPRRNLILVHFLTHLPIPAGLDAESQVTKRAPIITDPTITALEGAGAILAPFATAFSSVKLPGRCWLLSGCLPTRYKSGSDFDASDGSVSIQELTIEAEDIEQISLVDIPVPGL